MDPGLKAPQAETGAGRSVGQVLLLVFGSLGVLVSLALLAGGGFLLWLDQVERDRDGYLTTPPERLTTDAYALASEELELVHVGTPGLSWARGALGTTRVSAESQTDSEIFVGIGREAEVDRYLGDVEHDVVTELDYEPFSVDYDRRPGGAPASPPDEQGLWVASASGRGPQAFTWEIEEGRWTVVVMNADSSRPLAADVSAGATLPILLWVAIGFLVTAFLVAAASVLMLFFGARAPSGPGEEVAVQPRAPGQDGAYPVALEGEFDPGVSRGLWLVKWLLALPHYLVLAFLWIAFVVLTVVAGFAILFTSRYPRSIFDFNVGVLRWTWRVSFYGYSTLGTDRYPPFTLGAVPDYPARLEVVYPERLSRGLVLVKWWLLAVPHYVIVVFFQGGWGAGRIWGPGLVGVLVLFAAIALLFTTRYPRGIFDLVLGLNRWTFRAAAYAALMRDEYPPFRLDQGPKEPNRRGDAATIAE